MKINIFFKEFQYSIIAPLISSIVFIVILATITEYYGIRINSENSFFDFIIPGIIMMIVIQETYSNISETLIHMKQNGSFNDILIAPISRIEIAISFIIATTIIGLFMSIINVILIYIFVDIYLFNLWIFFYYIFLTTILFSSIGSIVGFISYTWDAQQSFFNFLIFPVSLLSGTFFSVNSFANEWQFTLLLNPVYHLVSNFRRSFYIDNQYYDLKIEILLLFFCFFITYMALYIFHKGYKVIS